MDLLAGPNGIDMRTLSATLDVLGVTVLSGPGANPIVEQLSNGDLVYAYGSFDYTNESTLGNSVVSSMTITASDGTTLIFSVSAINQTLFQLEAEDDATGFAGNDTITGGSGNDALRGYGGNNALDGGGGGNTLDYSASPASVTVDISNGTAVNGYGGTDTFSNFQSFIGSNADDRFISDAGLHTIDGGGGVNTVDYAGPRASYSIGFSNGAVTVTGNGTADTLSDVQYLQFADGTTKVRAPATDFDDDGRSDILLQNTDGQAAIWLVDGTTQTAAARVGANPGSAWHLKGTGDFNDDGKADLLWQNDDGHAAVWLMDGLTPTTLTRVGSNPGSAWQAVGAGDFNGDGMADILWQNSDGQLAIWMMNGTTVTRATRISNNFPDDWSVKGIGDFNGDGMADILFQSSTDNQAAIWLMNGATATTMTRVGNQPGPLWSIKGVGDFNGDGLADILWQNSDGLHGDSYAAIWLVDSTTVTSATIVGARPFLAWSVIGAGDFDGDGKSDILWQNSDGQAAIWLMNGTTVTEAARIGGNPGTAWHVIAPPSV